MSQTISPRLSIASIMIFLSTLIVGATQAQTVGIDLSFNAVAEKNASGTSPLHFILQPDDKYIVWGEFQLVNGAFSNRIARLNPDGTGDRTFNCTSCNFAITSVVLQPDGKIVVAGQDPSDPLLIKLFRLNSDGSLDTGFTSPFARGLGLTNYVSHLAVQPDGKLLVTVYSRIGQYFSFTLYRLDLDGSFDSSFPALVLGGGPGVSGSYPTKVAGTSDGKILVATRESVSVGSGDAHLRRYNPNGTVDSTFDQVTATSPNTQLPFHALIYDFEVLADGSVIIAGKFEAVNGFSRHNIARLLPAGNVDLQFGNPGLEILSGVAVQADNKILVSTDSTFFRLNSDGSLDNSFTAPLATIIDWTLDSTGRIVFNTSNHFGRLDLDGSLLSSFTVNFGVPGSVTALAVQADGKIILGGDYVRVDGVARNRIARVNADGSLDTAFDAGSGPNSVNSTGISKILVQANGKVIVVGDFTTFDGAARPSIARLNADGSLDTAFNIDVAPLNISTAALQADGKIVIGGSFSSVNDEARTGVARLEPNGSVDLTFNPIFESPAIRSLVAQPDGKIMVGGLFNGVNGFNRRDLVRLNADGTLDASFEQMNTAVNNGLVTQIELLPDGRYLVLTGPTVVRLESNGSTDASFTPPTPNSGGLLYGFLVRQNGSIILVGSFSQVNGVQSVNIARLTPDGMVTPNYFQGSDAVIRTITAQPDGLVLVGGHFSRIENTSRLSVARLMVDAASGRTAFDFDGDGRADVAVFRPSNGYWYQLLSRDGAFNALPFGLQIDRLAPADYDDDGKTDVAVFRDTVPGAGNLAYFYITHSTDNSFEPVQFGSTGDIPVSGDWDGDGKADVAVYRDAPTAGEQSHFYYRPSNTPGVNFLSVSWGTTGDKPVVGDFDGDGHQDAAVFRPSNATWYILRSSTGQMEQHAFGLPDDIPVPADFDGNGVTDIAVFRPSNGTWYTSFDPQTNYGAIYFGTAGDVPVAADYDGDSRADAAVFRPSTGIWYKLGSTEGFSAVQFGLGDDIPVPSAFTR